jgi:hypothetical protein
MARNVVVCGIALAMAVPGMAVASAPTPRPRGVVIEVEAGAHERRGTPVVFELPDPLKDVRAVRLTPIDGGRPVDAQVLALPERPPSVLWMLRDPLPAGATRRYRIEPADPDAAARAAVTCVDDGDHLRLNVGDRPVLQYNTAVVESPKGIAPYYRRSGQIHPLFTPSGRIVTDDFPPDHAHQHAVFFAWVNTTFEGRHLDFWNQKEQTGRIQHVATLETAGGPVFGQFRVRLRHDDLTAPGGPKPVLDEVWTVRAYNLADVFLVDFESRQDCVAASPLVMNEYRYGGMGLRGNRDWFDPSVKGDNPPNPARSGQSDFLTSEGKDRATGNHTRPTWVDLSGRIGDRPDPCGVTLLDHPGNFRFPQPIRIHPNKPYFCFAPMVIGTFEIAPGRPYVSRYRFAVHDGPPDVRAIARLWHDYAEPPRVRVVNESEP